MSTAQVAVTGDAHWSMHKLGRGFSAFQRVLWEQLALGLSFAIDERGGIWSTMPGASPLPPDHPMRATVKVELPVRRWGLRRGR